MKLIYTFVALLIITACSNSSNSDAAKTEDPTEITTSQEIAPKVEVEKSTSDLLMGTWVFEDPKINITQIITYNEDGTYALKMGELDISGTWELNDSILITKSRPDAPGQKKTITQLDETTLATFWEPKGGKGRELVYKRQ